MNPLLEIFTLESLDQGQEAGSHLSACSWGRGCGGSLTHPCVPPEICWGHRTKDRSFLIATFDLVGMMFFKSVSQQLKMRGLHTDTQMSSRWPQLPEPR